jgi:L-ascorbate metabolism protein UlaG (beta-lactamase superfamily)
MKIEWLGHSCFKITSHEYSICLDPYNPKMIPGIDKLEVTANLVLTSHQHEDHNYKEPVNIVDKEKPDNLKISYIETYHDDQSGKIRGKNKITIIEDDNIKVAHMGDLGTEPNLDQLNLLDSLDAIMIPVGGHYTIDALMAKKICNVLKPIVIIPMHYRSEQVGFKVLDTVENFVKVYHQKKVTYYKQNFIIINKNLPEHIAILKFES